MNTLVIYYSYGGNTREVAKKLQEKLTGEVLELEPVNSYTNDYQALVDDEEAKMDDAEVREIKEINIDFSKYDRVILGTPVWWYQIAPVLRGFLVKYKDELSNKRIDAFITNGGWIGHSIKDIEEYVTLNSYVNLEFDEHTIRDDSKKRLEAWIDSLK